MARPTTIRLPDDLLRELDDRAKTHGKDRASFLRELLRDALARDLEREVLDGYARGMVSLGEATRQLGIDPWELLERFRRDNRTLSVSLEDWIDSSESL